MTGEFYMGEKAEIMNKVQVMYAFGIKGYFCDSMISSVFYLVLK